MNDFNAFIRPTCRKFETKPTMPTNVVVYGLVALIMILVGRVQEVIPFLWNLHLAKLALVATILLYFTSSLRSATPLTSFPQVKTLLLLYGLGLVSTLFSYWPGRSLDFMLTEFLGSLIMVILLVKSVQNWQDLRGVAWGVVLTVALLAGSSMSVYHASERTMLDGTAYDPNDLAAIIVIFLPLVYFMMKAERGGKRLMLAGTGVLSMLTVMATQSRGGFLGLVAVVLVIMIREKVRLTNILLLFIVAIFLFSAFAPIAYQNRIFSLLTITSDYNVTAGGGRLEVWNRGLGIMASHPLLGVGPAVFMVAEGKTHADIGGKWSSAHNSFLQVGAELGVIGLFLFVGILGSSIKQLRQIRRLGNNVGQVDTFTSAIEIGLYGYIVTGFFLSHGYSAALFLLIGMSSALTSILKNDIDLTLSIKKT